jgi:hypothetical protein
VTVTIAANLLENYLYCDSDYVTRTDRSPIMIAIRVLPAPDPMDSALA